MLQANIEKLFDQKPETYSEEHFQLFQAFKDALNSGAVRAAEPDASARSGWKVNSWVKKGILLGFRMGVLSDMSIDRDRQPFFDKVTYPVRRLTAERRCPDRARWLQHPRRLLRGPRRHLHAAHVHKRWFLRG